VASAGGDGHSSGTPVAGRLLRPTRAAARRLARHLRLLARCLPLLLGLAPGGVFPAAAVAGGAVRSYRTVSPLPPVRRAGAGLAVYFLWHCPWGRPRRALPGTVPPWSPDFPLPAPGGERPSGRLADKDLVSTTDLSNSREMNSTRLTGPRFGAGQVSQYGLDRHLAPFEASPRTDGPAGRSGGLRGASGPAPAQAGDDGRFNATNGLRHGELPTSDPPTRPG
jgi:hypothetical protein